MKDQHSPSHLKFFFSSGRIFFQLAKKQFLLFLVLMGLSGLFESVGIVLFFPLFEHLQKDGAASGGKIGLWFLDPVLRAFNIATLNGVLLFIASIFLVKFLFVTLQGIGLQVMMRDFYRRISLRLLQGWSEADYAQLYLKQSAGYFSNILTREIWTFLGAFSHFCGALVNLLYIAIYLFFAALLDIKVTILGGLVGVVLFFLLRRYTTKTRQYAIESSREDERFHGGVMEFIQFYKYFKSTNSFSKFIKGLKKAVLQATTLRFKMGVISSFIGALPEAIAVLLVSIFIYVYVGVWGKNFGLIAVLLLLFYRTVMRIATLHADWQKFFGCSGALKKIPEALSQIAQTKEPQGGRDKKTFDQEIALSRVSFSFGERPILEDINMVISKNSTIALVGASGGGKSTLIDLITGVLKPTAGTISIDGLSYHDLSINSLRAMFGYVTQEITMFNDTLINNISAWDDASHMRVKELVQESCKKAFCIEFIENLPQKYNAFAGDRGINLSVGQRQRISIARELYRSPPILILDEATSALDSASEEFIRHSIENLKGKMTMIMVAHRLATIQHADYIYVIDSGRIVEEGAFSALYNNKQTKFYAMCELQQFGS